MYYSWAKIRRARDHFKRRKKTFKNIRRPTEMRIQYGGKLFAWPET
jgi:hypothetical protein